MHLVGLNLGWVNTCNVTAYRNIVYWQCGRDSCPRNVSKVGYAVTLRACSVCCRYVAVASKGWYGYGRSRCGRATWRWGWSSQISRQSAYEGGKVVSPPHRPPLPPRKYSWYSFQLEAESTPGPKCGRKDYVNEKLQWHHWGSNPQPSDL